MPPCRRAAIRYYAADAFAYATSTVTNSNVDSPITLPSRHHTMLPRPLRDAYAMPCLLIFVVTFAARCSYNNAAGRYARHIADFTLRCATRMPC